jgi:hypothetical protein
MKGYKKALMKNQRLFHTCYGIPKGHVPWVRLGLKAHFQSSHSDTIHSAEIQGCKAETGELHLELRKLLERSKRSKNDMRRLIRRKEAEIGRICSDIPFRNAGRTAVLIIDAFLKPDTESVSE